MIEGSIDDFIDNGIKDKVTDMKNPRCQACNECCSMGTMILFDEYKSLKKYFTTTEGHKVYKQAIDRIKKYTTSTTVFWMCPLSNSNRKCSIYSRRPKICKDFHCSPELLSKDFDKDKYEDNSHYLIYDLFYKRNKNA